MALHTREEMVLSSLSRTRGTVAHKNKMLDIVILGAGPAGCAAAIAAANAGLKVQLIELKPNSTKPIPGETLHPGVEPILRQLGVWDLLLECDFNRHYGIWRETVENIRSFVPYGSDADGPWFGIQVDRTRFHQILQSQFESLGGTTTYSKSIEVLKEDDKAISGICADGVNYKCSFVLDATGRQAWLGRKLELKAEMAKTEQRLQFGWKDGIIPGLNGQPLFIQRRDGWDWMAPLGNARNAWVRLQYSATAPGLDYTWRIYRDCAGSNYFLLGDAACLMDPSAANGVLRAMMAGIYSVHLIRSAISGEASPEIAAFEYRQWVSKLFDTTQASYKTLTR